MKVVIDISDERWVSALDGTWCGSAEIPKGIPLENVLQDIKSELWMEGMNMTGEYQGVWIRYKDIERVIDKHMSTEQ